ncbi:MAG: calcium/sodium antiporter, partial [Burkholderiaceae bacterium]|nr:calcium/sodium antiporter [Burkholderiaceae bacterium]
MLVHLGFFGLGLLALIAGAELLVRGASKLALAVGISPLVVGLTVVAFGTSAPEVAVSVGAAAAGSADVAVGNVVGSNILNVLLILGVTALAAPLAVHAQVVRQEVPVMLGATVLALALMLDRTIGRLEGALLLALLIAYVAFLVVQARRASAATADAYGGEVKRRSRGGARWDAHWAVQVLLVLVGLACLVVGARWLVAAATAFAQALGVPELVIGLTVVAAGTSLPEIATSVVAALRGERDIAVGNVVGSNVFNLLGCLGAAALVAPAGLTVAPAVLNFDAWVMLAVAVACLPIFITGREIARWEGALFLG